MNMRVLMNFISHGKRAGSRLILVAGIAVIAVGLVASRAQAARGEHGIVPPPLPANIQVPPGNTPYLLGHAVGTQNYICLPTGNEFEHFPDAFSRTSKSRGSGV